MFGAEKGSAANLDGSALAIGIVQARFNASITDSLAQACLQELAAMGVLGVAIGFWPLACKGWQPKK